MANNLVIGELVEEDRALLKRVEAVLTQLVRHAQYVTEYNTKLLAENERAFKLNDRIEALLPKLEKLVATPPERVPVNEFLGR